MLNASLNQEITSASGFQRTQSFKWLLFNLDENIPSSFLLIYHHNKTIENIEWEREKEREKKDINKSIPPSLNIKSKERSTRIFKNKFLICHCNLSDRGDICMWFSAVTCTLDLCMSSLSDMLVFLCVIIPALLFFFYCRNWFSAEINEKLYQTLKPIKRRIKKKPRQEGDTVQLIAGLNWMLISVSFINFLVNSCLIRPVRDDQKKNRWHSIPLDRAILNISPLISLWFCDHNNSHIL